MFFGYCNNFSNERLSWDPTVAHADCYAFVVFYAIADKCYVTDQCLPYGKIEVGAEADLVLLDLEKKQTIDRTTFVSKGKNTPFDGVECAGWPVMTIFGGNIAWKDGQ